MIKKRLIAFIMMISLILSSAFVSFADITAAMDLSAYDTSIAMFGVATSISYDQYDAESGLIPITVNANYGHGFFTDEENISSLVFINRKGETVIPANPNWDLVAGFKHGVALVRDKASNAVLRIDVAGNVLGTIDFSSGLLLPEDSQYSVYKITGNGDKYNLPEDDFSVTFTNHSGEQKTINLKDLGFHHIAIKEQI